MVPYPTSRDFCREKIAFDGRHSYWRLRLDPAGQYRHRTWRYRRGGGGYTYFNPQTGRELSAVTGLTYNFTNPSTDYRNGVDWHLDWGMSPVETGSREQSRLFLPTTLRRQRRETWRLQVTGLRHWPADRVHLPRRQHAGLSEFERLQGIRRSASSGRLERMGHFCDFTRRPIAACADNSADP
jgi:hypothetical protein